MGKLDYLRRLGVLMFTVFVDMMGALIIVPLLPYYAKEMGASDSVVGVLIAAFALAQLTTAPLWGRLSDHYGRRPAILVSLIISAGAFVLFGLAETVFTLLLSRLIQGVGGGTIGVVQAYVSDAVPPKVRTQALSWVTVATSAGVMLGPAVGSFTIRWGEAAPGFVAAGLCLLNLVFAGLYLGEAQEHEEDEPAAAEKEEPRQRTPLRESIVRIMRHPGARVSRLIWIYAVTMMAFMAMNGVIVLYLERVFEVTEEYIGWFYVYVGGVSLIMRAILVGPVVNRFGEVRTVRIGAASLLLGFLSIPLVGFMGSPEVSHVPVLGYLGSLELSQVQHYLLLAPAVMLIPVGTSLLFPATTSMVSQLSPRRETGQSLGVQQAFGGVSRVSGPLWSTAVFQVVAEDTPFWLCAGLMLVVLGISLRLDRVREEQAERILADLGEASSAEAVDAL